MNDSERFEIRLGSHLNWIFKDGMVADHINKTEFRLVSGKHFMPVWLSDRSHVNKIIPVWVCTGLMKSRRYCPWVSEDVVKHSWELLDFRLTGCLHNTSVIFILAQVPPNFLLFLCICLMITAQNVITVQVIPVWACPSSGTGSQ